MKYIYIDESGDLGDKYSSSKYFVIGEIIVDNPKYLIFNERFSSSLNNPNNCPISIIHGNSIKKKGLQIANLLVGSVFQSLEHNNFDFIDLIKNKEIIEVFK